MSTNKFVIPELTLLDSSVVFIDQLSKTVSFMILPFSDVIGSTFLYFPPIAVHLVILPKALVDVGQMLGIKPLFSTSSMSFPILELPRITIVFVRLLSILYPLIQLLLVLPVPVHSLVFGKIYWSKLIPHF